jgi:uncharacterized protein YecE (DUF72 family)
MKRSGKIHVGTSGWHYEHWKGPFYPDDCPKKDFLLIYVKHFQTTEINNTFYQLPKKKTLSAWERQVPDDFIFSVKASRYITHMKKLKDGDRTVPPLLQGIGAIGSKLGPILFQLPPRWKCNPSRLEAFLRGLPENFRYAFEFRDPSWFDPRVYDILTEHNAAFCMYELAGRLSPKKITAPFIYVRLHGPEGAYQGQYSTEALSGWAGAFSTWSSQGKDVFCYFDNDEAGYAAQDALKLKKMLS